jgi:hypothetical protein
VDDNKKSERLKEQDAVFTTIVGGRPPGSETKVGAIPRGVEVLVKKASVDAEFRKILIQKRGEAAHEIDLELTEAEKNMLSSISTEQLEKIIENTKVKPEHRAIFLGNVGKLMLVVVISVAVIGVTVPSLGHRVSRDRLEYFRKMQMERLSDANDVNEPNEVDAEKTENSRANQTEQEE